MNKNARLFLSYVLPSMWSACSSSVPTVSWIPFLSAGVQENSGLASVAVTWPLVMMFGAVGGDMLNRCGNYYRPVERQRQPAAGTAQPRQHAGLAGIVQPADDDCRQMFSDRYTPSVRRYRRTDARHKCGRYSRILIYGNLAYMLVTGVLAVIRNDGRRCCRCG